MNDQITFPLERLRFFSADGHIYRAFNHLIAARFGSLLLVPFRMVLGDLGLIQERCPVPSDEIYAVLEYPQVYTLSNPGAWPSAQDHVQQLEYLGLDPVCCEMDRIAATPSGQANVLRLVHPSGIRYAVVMP